MPLPFAPPQLLPHEQQQDKYIYVYRATKKRVKTIENVASDNVDKNKDERAGGRDGVRAGV